MSDPTADLSQFDTKTIAKAQTAVSEYVQWLADTGGTPTGSLSLFAQDALVHQFAWWISREAASTIERLSAIEQPKAEAIRNAVLSCGHTIDSEQITLRRSDGKNGNALRQLSDRIAAALNQSRTEPALND